MRTRIFSRATIVLSVCIYLICAAVQPGSAQVVTTFAGSTIGYIDATGTAARFNLPSGIAVTMGGVLYVADKDNHRIRRISSMGAVTTHAGSGTAGFADGMGTSAQFSGPTGVAMDGMNVIVADAGNHRIRRVNPGGNVTTIAGSTAGHNDATGAAAQFNFPVAVAVDGSGNIFVADFLNHCIRRVTSAGVVTTLAGSPGASGYVDATGSAARFNFPAGVAVDGSGNVYVADQLNHCIRRITPGGVVTTFAGNGTAGWVDGIGTAARFNQPTGLAFDGSGNLIVAEQGNHRIRQITPAGIVTTLAGSGTAGFMDATGTVAQFNQPTGVAVHGTTVYVADRNNHRIRAISPPPVPTITSISPTIAGAGMTVIITGTHLTGTADVKFGGGTAASITVISDTQVHAVVAPGSASGNVTLTAPGGTTTFPGFTFIPPPTLSSFTPTTTGASALVTLTGTNFIGVSSVTFGGTPAATFATISATQVQAVVAPASASGNVQITTSGGTVSLGGFTFVPPPTVTGIVPSSAASGATVTITGTNFTGATSVTLGGVPVASFTVISATQISAVVAAGGATGNVQVSTIGGTGTYASFTFIPPPIITAFTPSNGGAGTSLTITGTNLSGATSVTVGGTPATIVTNTATVIVATVGAGATGFVQVTTPGGTATSTTTFTWHPAPTIASFTPASGAAGATITITGTNFTSSPPSEVRFGGILAASINVISSTQIQAVVSAAGASGAVQVTTPGGTASVGGFTFLPSPPTITGLMPTVRCIGGNFTITGTNFIAPATVTVNGTPATGVTVVSTTAITANVGPGSSTGLVSVTTPGGTTTSTVSMTIAPTPSITSFSPASQTAGGTVTILGSGFTGATAVRFGTASFATATPAASYTVVSDTQIDAVVGSGATGSVFVQSPGGCVASAAGFTFSAPMPTITSFSPTTGIAGTVVTIIGSGFTGTTGAAGVRFGGVNAASYTVISDTQINATVAAGGASGNVTVNAPGGSASLGTFTFAQITSFTPVTAATGMVVTINGAGFTGATAVRFGNTFMSATPALGYTVVSDNQINATVGAGATGRVWVQIPAGTISRVGFTYVPAPTLTSFTPTIQGNGGTVTLTGTNFIASPLPTVTFGGIPATSVTYISPTQLQATVGSGASGTVQVTTIAGSASQPGFIFAPAPTITSFTPASAPVGGTVTINGSGFFASPLPTVSFGGVPATSVTYISPTQITAVVSTGASGTVQVTTPGGTASLAGFQLAPTITSFSPASAGAGTTVTINGSGFSGATAVSFGGVPAASFVVVSSTQITAVVAAGSMSGNIQVTTPAGTATLAGFTFVPPPTIISFTPTSATGGTTVVITGTNFTGATAVSFGGIPAASFTVMSPTQINAVVSAAGASGNVVVTTPGGTATQAGFTFIPLPPTITSFSPTSAGAGTTVTIIGTNFAGVSTVMFGGVPAASYTVVSPTHIDAVVSAGGASGSVLVTALGGTIMVPGFTFIPPPTITSFTPTSAGTGTVVTITGTNFTGATAVSFGGVPAASFTVVSATQITATVAAGASGAIQVTTPGGTGTQPGFMYIPGPSITSFTPTSAPQGATVTINGTNFIGVTSVSFGGVPASSFTVISPTQITAVVASGATGAVSVTAAGGTANSAATFTFIPPPSITSFSPTAAAQGATVLISGSGFTGATAVSFGGVAAAGFSVITDNLMTAVVGTGASGTIVVTGPGGTGTRTGFTFVPGPMITGFTPTSAGPGMAVVITGAGFIGATGASAVQFGGVNAASYTVVSATEILAIVPVGAMSGAIQVTTPGGTNALGGFTYVPPPTIITITPTMGGPSTTVTITGTNFTGATSVTIGGTPAASFTVVSPTQITAVVGTGATGNVTVFTPGGSASLGVFTFVFPPPAITSFTPTATASNSTVTIIGVNFLSVSSVTFGGTPASSFSVISPTQIQAVVGSGSSGNVAVTTPGGTATLGGYVYYPPPTLTSFTPTSAPTGTIVTINGTNLSGASSVLFGSVPAASFTVISSTQIQAQVGAGMSGNITVTTSGGTVSISGFTYLPPPSVVSFIPSAAGPGMTVTINGANFVGVTSVQFGGVPAASFTVVSPTQITAVVPASGSTGSISVTSSAGTGSLAGFAFFFPPSITAFTPTARGPGGLVTITGANFVGVSSVRFGGVPAVSFTVNSPTQITAVVGSGASGNVSVQNPGGTGSLAGFTFVPTPTITSFTPTSGQPNDEIIINGTNFIGVSTVGFGSVTAASFTVISPTQIRAVVPGSAGTTIFVVASGGTASLGGFRFIPAPTVTGFIPASGRPGDIITIVGTNLSTVRRVTFGGAAAAGFMAVSPTVISAVVGDYGASGHVTVETPDGTDSIAGFTFIFPTPHITDFTPKVAGPGMTVTITGTGFIGASTASFGGVPAASMRFISPTQITAVVGTGASGAVAVTTPGGVASKTGFIFYPAPVITNIVPSAASPGDTITIIGAHLNEVTSVRFGTIPALHFTIVSSTHIRAVVPPNAGAVEVTSPGGTAISSAFTINPPPVILRFMPSAAASHGTVSIIGRNFIGARSVSFGGVPAASFTVVSDTLIRAIVGAGASGVVTVATTAGSVSLAGFRYILPPVISSIMPIAAGTGATIHITGMHLLDVTSATLGDVLAAVRVISATELALIVPTHATLTHTTIRVYSPAGVAEMQGFRLIPAPELYGFSPERSGPNQVIRIVGRNLSWVYAVHFGGVTAANIIVQADTLITATVAQGASGNVVVISSGGTASLIGFVYVPPSPTIISFSPTSAGAGTTVTILGINFIDVSDVRFGNVSAQSFVVLSPTEIRAVVATTASGSVSVITRTGIGLRDGFIFIPPPTLTGFTPSSAGASAIVRIIGTHLDQTQHVSFGGIPAASFTVVSPTELHAVLSTGASGSIVVTTRGGTASISGFSFIPPPQITGFSPRSGAQGTLVTINGTNLASAQFVGFGGITTNSITVVSPTQITAIVPTNASTGFISITTRGGTATSTDIFTFLAPPVITGFSPTALGVGGVLTIYGMNFTTTAIVRIGTTNAPNVMFISSTELRVIVPLGTAGGSVTVITQGGLATRSGFTLLAAPRIASFAPAIASSGTIVTITGANLAATVSVRFGEVSAASFRVLSDTQVQAVVGTGASGSVSISTPAGTASLHGFVYLGAPVITGFAPSRAGTGRVVTIVGDGFTGTRSVSFGGVPAARFTVISPTQIAAVVGSGASGEITVINNGGSRSIRGFTFIPAPIISSFSPTVGAVGTRIAIRGTNLREVTSLAIGGVSIPFTIHSDDQITAQIPLSGVESGVITVSSAGGIGSSDSAFTFIPPPQIRSVNFVQSRQGLILQIFGQHFIGTTTVTIGQTAVPFTVVNQGQLNAALQAGMSPSDHVSVMTPGGRATSSGMLPVPAISAVNPSRGSVGTRIVISGQYLDGTSYASIGGISVPFTVLSPTRVEITIPPSGASGVIGLVTPHGTVTTTTTFTLITNEPLIIGFTPTQGDIGTIVRVQGENFHMVQGVFIGGMAVPYRIVSSQELRLTIPIGATSGNIVLISPVGVTISSGRFTFVPDGVDTVAALPPVPIGTLRCYPNPAADKITVEYTLDRAQTVRVLLFDTRGIPLETIERGRQPEGEHSALLSVAELPAGTYLVVVETTQRRLQALITVVR